MNYEMQNDRVILKENGMILAEITFPRIEENSVDINHTFVDESLRGQGIAGVMMEKVVDHLIEQHLRAKCSCSYAIKWFEKHPEYKALVCE